MKKAFVPMLLAGISVLMLVPAAHAADGLVEFDGVLTSATCTINNGSKDFTVTLPPMSTKTLAAPGSWAGRQGFKLSLTDCTPSTGIVSAYLEPGPTVNSATGNLKPDAGGATKVEVALLNSSYDPIDASKPIGQQNVDKVSLASGKADLQFYAQYQSLGNATAGAVKSRVNYTITYQ
ncbi:fimbrial protein [Burkholderia cepacia]|uniref:fimbrial protein n=1 Tax=Burkholderia cepacia TaxID=292 RepID=UPI002349117C|nr:fimbrial protein [Burkholderia cepacia]MDC6104153.1 fimbrial protein [Burkholderia cepacia]